MEMIKGFWANMPKFNKEHEKSHTNRPFFVLAPMADVTDFPFRQIISSKGNPDVFWTEFVSADGLAHPVAREKLLIDLKFTPNQHPIVAQIFGSNKENIKSASELCRELGFDGVDINMGCPDRSIEKQGAGASMIKNFELAREIIESAREGAGNIPVSVKTRIGYNKNEIDTWIRNLLTLKLPVLTVHLRTRKEMSLVPAHWELMQEIIKLRDEISPETLIIGNGDILNIEDGYKKASETGCDGLMLGRAIFGNPWLFRNKDKIKQDHNLREKLLTLVEHTELFEKELIDYKSFAIMKKHYKAYVNGFDGAKDLRVLLMDAKDSQEVKNIINDFLAKSDIL